MIVGAYTVDLYCDDPKHGEQATFSSGVIHVRVSDTNWAPLSNQFSAQTERECLRQARQAGWIFKRNREVICPLCKEQTQ